MSDSMASQMSCVLVSTRPIAAEVGSYKGRLIVRKMRVKTTILAMS